MKNSYTILKNSETNNMVVYVCSCRLYAKRKMLLILLLGIWIFVSRGLNPNLTTRLRHGQNHIGRQIYTCRKRYVISNFVPFLESDLVGKKGGRGKNVWMRGCSLSSRKETARFSFIRLLSILFSPAISSSSITPITTTATSPSPTTSRTSPSPPSFRSIWRPCFSLIVVLMIVLSIIVGILIRPCSPCRINVII